MSKATRTLLSTISLLLTAGMDVRSALAAAARDTKNKKVRQRVTAMMTEVEEGGTLSEILERYHFVSPDAAALIRVGESSGRLSVNMRTVVEQIEKDRVLGSKVRGALTYPALVLGLTITVGLGIAWFILPRLAGVFASMHITLPPITRILIAGGTFLQHYGAVVVPGTILFCLLAGYIIFFWKPTRGIGETLLFLFPGIKTLLTEIEVARFTNTVGTLLSAGVPLVSALHAASATRTRRYTRFFVFLESHLSEGHSWAESFAAYPHIDRLIPVPLQNLIVAGDQSGRLSEVLLSMSEALLIKTESTIKNLSVFIEPLLLVLVWVGVVFVALAVILPIYSLIGNFNP